MSPQEHPYDNPGYLTNIFEEKRKHLTPEERQDDDEAFAAFADWMLMEEDDET